MNAKEALRISINMGQLISMGYLEDLTDEEMMHRAGAGVNHIKWQVGHLIASENNLINQAVPGSMPELPAGFAEKYTPETASNDDPGAFDSKETLLKLFNENRAGTLAALDAIPNEDLSRDTGLPYAPQVACLFEMQGSHWVMHAGQWAVARRQLGRPPLF